jgi:uncharacterized protein (DUF1501 family)
MPRACDDCTRSELFRAAAGRGLPAIEPGMPAPAGAGLTRRSLLLRSAGLALSVYGAGRLDLLAAQEAAAASGPAEPVVVQVFLAGGVDSLSFLAPVGDAAYRRLRPRLAIAPGAGPQFSEDPRLHWHPSAAPLAQLHAEGKVAVMPAVGYAHPDQSHFVSRHFYEVGALDPQLRTGWMGRYLDRVGSPDNPLQGLSLSNALSPALASSRVPVAAVDSPSAYSFWARDVWGDVNELMLEAFADIGRAHGGGDAAIRQAASAASQAGALRHQLQPLVPKESADGGPDESSIKSPVAYPSAKGEDFPDQLAALAAMLAAGLPLRCVAVQAPGQYDTHADQKPVFDGDLKLTCASLLAFQRDLEARGLADRVVIHVWSEFGRRAAENGGGTDHGAAGLGLLIGSRVNGRMIGEFPGLDRLDPQGNLVATSDFRSIYSSLLEQWLGTDAAGIIPDARSVGRVQVIR